MAFYWCTDHHTVENGSGCRSEVRLGPYPTEAEAQHALESVKERNDKLDAEDRAWEDGND